MFRQRDLFKILISERRIRHRELLNKGNIMREFDTGDIVVVRNQAKSSRKDGVTQKLAFKIEVPYIFL